MSVLFSLAAPVRLSAEGYSVPAFASAADRVQIDAAGTAAAPFSVEVLSLTAAGDSHSVYRGEIRPDEAGAFTFRYGFDPVHLAVYHNAVSFTVRLTAAADADASLTSFTVTGEDIPAGEKRAAVSLSRVRREENGDLSVPVLGADGSVITVPAVPQKVLLIGNSLLLGLFLKYGMCASSPRRDYAYHLTGTLRRHNPAVTVEKLYGSPFECLENPDDFEKWYSADVNPYTKKPAGESFTADLDLIVIQLSDNVNTDAKKAAFPETADRLLARIKSVSPRARVVWVHGWYNKNLTEEAILALTEKWQTERVDISALRDKDAEATRGQIIEDGDGNPTVADDRWITHPGNEGMRRIADAILSVLGLA